MHEATVFPKLLPMQLLLHTVTRAGKEPGNKSSSCIDRGYTKKKGTHLDYDSFLCIIKYSPVESHYML